MSADQLLEAERDLLERDDQDEPRTVADDPPSGERLREQIAARVREKVFYTDLPPKLRQRAERDFEYRVHHTEEKGKFVRAAEPFLPTPPRTILDLGGGQGGTLTAFRRRFHPEAAILLDLDPEWLDVARWRDPETEVIRGDAVRMPLRDGVVDLLVTTATLEHIPDWRASVGEMMRVAHQGFLCYGPNGGFPYDFGHLDAPVLWWLPRKVTAWLAFAWHALRRTGRTLESIRGELAHTFYIPRSSVVRELRRRGVEVRNIFSEFLRESVRDDYHMTAGGLKRALARRPALRRTFSRLLLTLGAEPNVYLFWRRGEKP